MTGLFVVFYPRTCSLVHGQITDLRGQVRFAIRQTVAVASHVGFRYKTYVFSHISRILLDPHPCHEITFLKKNSYVILKLLLVSSSTIYLTSSLRHGIGVKTANWMTLLFFSEF
jgi:hypothetical protein